ncbi:hypothetical protein BN2476_230310 [Paraburkholderia piptadeniae]|uniref:Uncharacterized protein n=1 Tax=Paraburkholderia piptadeniae TaxID=1701573 RepID=A0A1N7RY27_9BURK|nr:hypothetical protein BN2476_230310 [Paraburkholderia piptadeniae]
MESSTSRAGIEFANIRKQNSRFMREQSSCMERSKHETEGAEVPTPVDRFARDRNRCSA